MAARAGKIRGGKVEILKEHIEIYKITNYQNSRKTFQITTTPSLFAINEVNYEDNTTKADIVAQFPWRHPVVETISTVSETQNHKSSIKCSLTLENAMFILLLDGMNNTRKDYLGLHREMTPYKIAFALQAEDSSIKSDLGELAKFMYFRLKSRNIATCTPDFTNPLEEQIRENLLLGVTYTAILYANTLTNGIFHLLNSSTMLKEEVHVGDFESYASLICMQSKH